MNDYSYKEDLTIRFQNFLKQNVIVFAIILISVVYVFYGVATIEKTGQTIEEIVAKGGIGFLVGFGIKLLESFNGLIKGELTPKFIATKEHYLRILDDTAPIQQYLPRYCELENEATLRRIQTSILRKANVRYDDFINDTIDYSKLDKKQKKAIKKARNVEFAQLNDAILLSDSQVSDNSVKDLNVSKANHLKFSTLKMTITMVLMAVLFGLYAIDPEQGFDWSGALWCGIQIAIYIVLGVVEYFKSYMFINDTYRTALVRKANHLERFKNMYNENPNRFKEEELEFLKTKKEEKKEIDVNQ